MEHESKHNEDAKLFICIVERTRLRDENKILYERLVDLLERIGRGETIQREHDDIISAVERYKVLTQYKIIQVMDEHDNVIGINRVPIELPLFRECEQEISLEREKRELLKRRISAINTEYSDIGRPPQQFTLDARDHDTSMYHMHKKWEIQDSRHNRTSEAIQIYNRLRTREKSDLDAQYQAIRKIEKVYIIFAHASSTLYIEPDLDTFTVPPNTTVITSSQVGKDLLAVIPHIETQLTSLLRQNLYLFEDGNKSTTPLPSTLDFERTILNLSFKNHLEGETVNNLKFDFTNKSTIRYIFESPDFDTNIRDITGNILITTDKLITEIRKQNNPDTKISFILIGCRGDKRDEYMNNPKLLENFRLRISSFMYNPINAILSKEIPNVEKAEEITQYLYTPSYKPYDPIKILGNNRKLNNVLIRLLSTFPNKESFLILSDTKILELIKLTSVQKGSPRFSARERSPRGEYVSLLPELDELIVAIITSVNAEMAPHIVQTPEDSDETSIDESKAKTAIKFKKCIKIVLSTLTSNKYIISILQHGLSMVNDKRLSVGLIQYIGNLLIKYFRDKLKTITTKDICETFDINDLYSFLTDNLNDEIIAEQMGVTDSVYETMNNEVAEQKIKKIMSHANYLRAISHRRDVPYDYTMDWWDTLVKKYEREPVTYERKHKPNFDAHINSVVPPPAPAKPSFSVGGPAKPSFEVGGPTKLSFEVGGPAKPSFEAISSRTAYAYTPHALGGPSDDIKKTWWRDGPRIMSPTGVISGPPLRDPRGNSYGPPLRDPREFNIRELEKEFGGKSRRLKNSIKSRKNKNKKNKRIIKSRKNKRIIKSRKNKK